MLVSCICPTYGRPPDCQHLLEEAIESFLVQDWGDKELIVFNDAPMQELVCTAPKVRVVNLPHRVDSLGQKYNLAIRASRGALICPWEDDDISLPHRISLSVELLADGDYHNPRRYWFLDRAGLHGDHPMGYGHNCSIFTYSSCLAVGGYPAISGAQDAVMDARLRQLGNVRDDPIPMEQWSYIYRWGVSPMHLSGAQSPPDAYLKVGQQGADSGRFILRPQWRQDYTEMCRDRCFSLCEINRYDSA